MTSNTVIRALAFLLILCTVIYVLCDLFEHENGLMSRRYETFYSLERNTVDGIFVGTSGVDRYWMAGKAYADHGLTVYPLSTDSQPSWLIPEIIDEARRSQDLKLVIIDIRSFVSTPSATDGDQPEVAARRVIDTMDFLSVNRLQSVFKTTKVLEEINPELDTNALELYFSFIKYHSRWNESNFSFTELKDYKSQYLGFYVLEYATIKSMEGFPEYERTDIRSSLDPVCEAALNDLFAYLEDKDFEVLFINTPHYMPIYEAGRTNTVCDMVAEAGYKYLNYDMEDNLINVNRDYYDDGHVNYYGAVTFTDMFSEYLLENYELCDYRDDERVSKDWGTVYDAIKEKVKLLEYVAPIGKTPIFAETTKSGKLNVYWYPVDNCTGYQVFRNDTEGGRYELIATIDGMKTTWFVDESAKADKTYYYMVRPIKSDGSKGLYSSTVSYKVESSAK